MKNKKKVVVLEPRELFKKVIMDSLSGEGIAPIVATDVSAAVATMRRESTKDILIDSELELGAVGVSDFVSAVYSMYRTANVHLLVSSGVSKFDLQRLRALEPQSILSRGLREKELSSKLLDAANSKPVFHERLVYECLAAGDALSGEAGVYARIQQELLASVSPDKDFSIIEGLGGGYYSYLLAAQISKGNSDIPRYLANLRAAVRIVPYALQPVNILAAHPSTSTSEARSYMMNLIKTYPLLSQSCLSEVFTSFMKVSFSKREVRRAHLIIDSRVVGQSMIFHGR